MSELDAAHDELERMAKYACALEAGQVTLKKRIEELVAERDRMRELLESAKHWLTLPPTTGSDRYCVEVLCREIKSLLSRPDPLASSVVGDGART